ncbi:MAG: tetratricopeptide repeat protein [Bryobacteraceae bacterium]
MITTLEVSLLLLQAVHVPVTGDLVGLADAGHTTVELHSLARPGDVLVAPVAGGGHFEMGGADPGQYFLVVQSFNGVEIKRTLVDVRPGMGDVEVRFPQPTPHGTVTPTVSLQRLKHPIPRPARKLYEKAEKERLRKHSEAALANYRAAVESCPEFVEAWNNYGSLLLILGRYSEAQVVFQRAAAVEPSAMVLTNLGAAWLGLKRYSESQLAAEAALRADSHCSRAHYLLASHFLRQRRMKEAAAHLSAAAPDVPEAGVLLNRLLAAEGTR